MNLGFTPLGSFKKMTRKYEDISDLQEFFAGFQQLEGPERTQFLLDNVNIPATVNFLVGLVITAHGDCCSKNLYIYRDTEGTGEWEPLPYDLDNSFGRGGALDDPFYPHNAGVDIVGRGDNDLFLRCFRTCQVLCPCTCAVCGH